MPELVWQVLGCLLGCGPDGGTHPGLAGSACGCWPASQKPQRSRSARIGTESELCLCCKLCTLVCLHSSPCTFDSSRAARKTPPWPFICRTQACEPALQDLSGRAGTAVAGAYAHVLQHRSLDPDISQVRQLLRAGSPALQVVWLSLPSKDPPSRARLHQLSNPPLEVRP